MMCTKEQVNDYLAKINLTLPSWSDSAESVRERLARLRCALLSAAGAAGDAPPAAAAAAPAVPRKPMRAARTGWGLCPCVQNDEPPEITYCVVGGSGGGLALQAVTPTLPQPPPEELDKLFSELVEFLRKKATNDQIEKLITAMERDPPMSNGYKGCPPEKKRRKEVVWDQLAKRLNAVPGGAIKDGHKWWKVWIDYRQNTKRKASKMLMQRSKNGESSLELSELEVRLLNMLGSEVVWGVDRALSTQLMSLPDHEYMAQSPETSRSDPQKVYPGKSQLSTSKPASVQISEPLPLFVTEKEEPIELESSDIENEEDRLQENIVQEVTIEEILAEELDLTAVNRDAMMQLPAAKKWQIYCSRRPPGAQTVPAPAPPSPDEYVRALNDIAEGLNTKGAASPADARLSDELKTALRTSAHSFVLRFVRAGGLAALLDALAALHARDHVHDHNLHASLVAGVKALMNNSTGRAHVLAHPTSINIIAQSLNTESIKTKVAALEILGAVCLVPGGHKKVLEAMIHYQKYAFERARFQGIVNDLDRSTGAYRDEVNLKTAIMSFVNAVLNYGPGVESLEFRLHLRYEFLMLGIQPVLEKLRQHENETLDRHVEFFELVRAEDERELARRWERAHVDTKSAANMFQLLRRKLSHTPAYPHLLSLLQHLLLMPFDYGPHTQHWLLLDRIVQQIVLQQRRNETPSICSQDTVNDSDTKSSTQSVDQKTEQSDSEATLEAKPLDPDVSPLEINVGEIVQLLAKEEELVAARTKAETLEKENVDMATELAKKERVLDQQAQEREELESGSARLKDKLEKETAAHMEADERARAALYRAHQLEQQLTEERSERIRFEKLVGEGSLPDDAKVSNIKIASIESCPPPPPPMLAPPPPPPCMPAAPPPLPAALAHVPPPPPAPLRRKNVPQSTNPLKSFNWAKLPESKLAGTIWQEIDESELYETMDLEAIDKIFCAYQKNGVQNEGSVEDLRQLGTKPRTKILSVIDGRRAQNCTILLSKLKMTDEEICRAILNMDSGEQIPIDMLEQLSKFTPSAEEAAMLEEHQDELDNMARADRFLYEISKIPHYGERLRALLFVRRFAGASGEAGARVAAVLRAARDVQRSRRLRTLLQIVLAIGNYMNRGARGNASGFRLSSLNKLADTKSSLSRNTTLLHYLVEVLESKFKDVLHLEEELAHVRPAAKVCVEQLGKDVGALRAGLADVQRELDYHRAVPPPPHDAFLPVMREFHAQAACRLSELEDHFQDMKCRLESCAALFGEEARPERLFGALDTFLAQLSETRAECAAARRRREEDERRAKHEQELKKRTMERKQASSLLTSVSKSLGLNKKCNGETNGQMNGDATQGPAKGEFDDLISALRTGDVFGEDMAKFKRARKTSKSSQKGKDSPPRQLSREDSRERTSAK